MMMRFKNAVTTRDVVIPAGTKVEISMLRGTDAASVPCVVWITASAVAAQALSDEEFDAVIGRAVA